MYVTCIGILRLYDTKGWITIFMFAMISCGPFSVLCYPTTCNTLCPTKLGLEGTYMSPPGGSMYTYMGHVWRSTTHPTLPGIKKRPSLWKVRSRSYVACVCIPNPNSGVTYWLFHKILKPRATYIFQVKARRQCTVDGGADKKPKILFDLW